MFRLEPDGRAGVNRRGCKRASRGRLVRRTLVSPHAVSRRTAIASTVGCGRQRTASTRGAAMKGFRSDVANRTQRPTLMRRVGALPTARGHASGWCIGDSQPPRCHPQSRRLPQLCTSPWPPCRDPRLLPGDLDWRCVFAARSFLSTFGLRLSGPPVRASDYWGRGGDFSRLTCSPEPGGNGTAPAHPDTWLRKGPAQEHLFVSRLDVLASNGGRHWRWAGTVPLPPESPAVGPRTTANLVVHGATLLLNYADLDSCAMHGCGTAGSWESTDGGKHWAQLPYSQAGQTGCGPTLDNPAAFSPAGVLYQAAGVPLAACSRPAVG